VVRAGGARWRLSECSGEGFAAYALASGRGARSNKAFAGSIRAGVRLRALRLYGPWDLRLEEVEVPEPPEGWALVKMEAVGICGTDKAFYRGTYPLFKRPLIPGHEVVGRVVEGPERLLRRRVVAEINFSCLKCEVCRSGLYTHCPRKKTLGIDFDGGMAEYFVAPVPALHAVESLDPWVGVFVEPLAAVLNAVEQFPVKPSHRAAVLGSGNLAILTVQVLKLLGVREVVAVVRRDSPKRRYVSEAGAEVVELEEALKRESSFDVVFEETGSNEGLDIAIRLAKPRGVVHIKSTPGGKAAFDQTLAVVKEVRIIGTRCGTFREFKRAIELLSTGLVRPVVTTVAKLSQGREAFSKALSREEVKVILTP